MSKQTYTIRAKREGEWWSLIVPELEGVYSQSRRLDQAEDMIREVIEIHHPEWARDDYELALEIDDPAIRAVMKAQLELRAQFEEIATTMRDHQRVAIEKLREDMKLPMRDIGRLLDVSHQRVSQLIAEGIRPAQQKARAHLESGIQTAQAAAQEAFRTRDKV